MPSKRRGYGIPGSGYKELEAQKLAASHRSSSPKERSAIKKSMENINKHKMSINPLSKYRSPRI